MKNLTRLLATGLLWATGLQLAVAQSSDITVNEDELFGSDEIVEEIDPASDSNVADSLLISEAVRIGGSFSGFLNLSAQWYQPWTDGLVLPADQYGLTPTLQALLYFDARPTAESRFYGSLKTGWPFIDEAGALNLQVFELFSDFNWNDQVFFRFGKQTINWGVGYFFSPADIINLQVIDPQNPTVQREGPVALRVHLPISGSQHNLWAYAIFPGPDIKPEDTAIAAKAEFVVGGWELGVGGWYNYDRPLRGVLTASGSLGQVSIFGEAYFAHGSDRQWIDSLLPNPLAPVMLSDDSSFFFKGSAGLQYNNSQHKISLAAQYLFDGEGYAPDRRQELLDQAAAIPSLPTPILKAVVANSGQHYAAACLNRSDFLINDLSASLFCLTNLSDLSGFIQPSLSYRWFSGASSSLSVTFVFGPNQSEYIILNDGPAINLNFSLTLGSGIF
ncbi:MAG: hypothetical protein A2087_09080 [Spirochaetes bacterium GWD1_61_31]|nr:MAG: hypothetical protein A2Y37_04600 [Spirochaetes bacterium GWB1_60_80]OHD33065.1 MAG: hypothetical protein A2004_07465 [Spirochaetes bacterium GWC1_61_12]OHD44366.1 MAG: hypothetical protein A2087_09080 [Spirochaetes bacterium GWD1_61_31]OHD46899.1 MAG: hypothetical protein A2Y35_01035 [Spirochaetes bacterium GWE1_60_18]OHD61139.1 MAG: hypothetical protein A2Y32_09670 [Spirochaetes bacterium GWF1_60_12]HAX37560.1 hypothetical protein [Spirochaetaceae bacterium]